MFDLVNSYQLVACLRRSDLNISAKDNGSKRALFLLKRSFVTPNVLRKYPLLASLHRGVDGALIGVIVSGTIMTTLALHSPVSYTHLRAHET